MSKTCKNGKLNSAISESVSKGQKNLRVKTEPIAIIGIGCRFPGDANSAEAFWHLLVNGVDAITEVPKDRFNIDAFHDPRPGMPGKVVTRYGGFLKGLDKFDASFFDISPREAESLDPQQRLLLEVAWEALEDAGIPLETISGSQAGVFIGIYSSDYEDRMFADIDSVDSYAATGSALYSAAGRLSYAFNLQGPSMAIATACSSSLVSTHLALNSLRTGESEMALAGGVNLILNPQLYIAYSKGGMLSPDGRSKFGDKNADGFVRGEGCGIVVLKPLSKAQEHGDRIYALIMGSAANNDGRRGHFLAPSPEGQADVMRQAYSDAGIQPSQVHYIEAHGTGTAVGDPVEIETLNQVMGENRSPDRPCLLGSVKTNFGHLEGASGIAGLIKAALCLHHRQIPPSLHFHEPNPAISWDHSNIRIQKEVISLATGSEPAIIGVNAFGLTGMNAHVILQETSAMSGVDRNQEFHGNDSGRTFLLPLSAHSDRSLSATTQIWQNFLGGEDTHTESLFDICYTASTRRTHHKHRLAIIGSSKKEILEQLEKHNRIDSRAAVSLREESEKRETGPVFVFSGQGPQWFAMGRSLLAEEPVYREMVERCDELLREYASWSLLDELQAEESCSHMDQTGIAQPAIFALQMGLAALWRSWGIEPDGVVGHSIGEVAAACVAGVLNIEEAVRVVYHRGRLLQRATGQGKMAAVEMSLEETEQIISRYEGRLSVGAVNSPTSMTLSGEREPLEEVLASLEGRNVFCRMLKVNYAFHSPQIEPYQEEMSLSVEGICPKPPKIPIISTVTGKAAVERDYGADYWAENIRRPVQFSSAMDELIREGNRTFLEIGPHPVLAVSISQCLEHGGHEGHVLASLRRGQEERGTMLEALGALYVERRPVEWKGVYPQGGRCVPLPTYPWQKKPYWISKIGKGYQRGGMPSQSLLPDATRHPLLGRRIFSPLHTFEAQFSLHSQTFLADHRIKGAVIVPAAVYLEMIFTLAKEIFGDGVHSVEDMTIHEALLLPQNGSFSVQTILTPKEGNVHLFQIFSAEGTGEGGDNNWKLHASGNLFSRRSKSPGGATFLESFSIEELKKRCKERLSGKEYYQSFGRQGLQFGPSFQGIGEIWLNEGEAIGKIDLPEPLFSEAGSYHMHPVLLDACLQPVVGLLPEINDQSDIFLMTRLGRFRLYRRPETSLWSYATLKSDKDPNPDTYEGRVKVLNEAGETIAEAEGILLKRVKGALLRQRAEDQIEDWFYEVAWLPKKHVSLNETSASPYLPSPSATAEDLQSRFDQLGAVHGLKRFQMLFPKLEILTVAYAAWALEQLGLDFRSGECFSFDSLTERLGVVKRHFQLFSRLLEMLTEEGILKREHSKWALICPSELTDPKLLLEQLMTEYPECKAELTLTGRCGTQLVQVLQGRCEPLQLLFPGEDIISAEKLYQDSTFSKTGNVLVQRAISNALKSVPSGGKVRILELGAGTGGTTSFVLPDLPTEQTEYVFTDISPFFLTAAEKKFRDIHFIKYRLLDIEKDPKTQGFEPHQFDFVLAANVLHATKDLGKSLEHVKQLLASEGLLIILEVTVPQRWIDLTFGMTKGWWRFSDSDLRPSHPLLSQGKWLKLIEQKGFIEGRTVPDVGFHGKSPVPQAVIIARGPSVGDNLGTHDKAIFRGVEEWGRWLVFADKGDIGWKLAEQIRLHGKDCILVFPGDVYEPPLKGEARVNPERHEDFKHLICDITATGEPTLEGAVHLWSLNGAETETTELSRLEIDPLLSCCSASYLAQVFADTEISLRPSLWLVTQGGQPIEKMAGNFSIRQAPIWGLGRVISLEQPEVWGGLVDLDPQTDPEVAASDLFQEIFRPDGEDQIAFRGEKRYVARLTRSKRRPQGTKTLHWHRDGTYLITGGLGGLGLKVAHWMADHGARHLVLLGRKGLSEVPEGPGLLTDSRTLQKVRAVNAIEKMGTSVKVVSADVSDEPRMSLLFKAFGKTEPPLKGVIHAAATIDLIPFKDLNIKAFESAFRSKVMGSWILHKLTRNMDLDFFVLFSSGATIWGSKDLGHYAAANQFLDALAHYRQAHGLAALTINWGWWAGGATTKELENYFTQIGLNPMSDEECLEALKELLESGAVQKAVSNFDWGIFGPILEAKKHRPFLEQILTSEQFTHRDVLKEEGPDLRRRLAEASSNDRREILMTHVRQEAAQILGFSTQDLVDLKQGFFNMGMDSIMTLQLKNRLEAILGLELSPTLAFEYPNMEALSVYLAEELFPSKQPVETSKESPVFNERDTPSEDQDELTEDELAELLAQKLKARH